MQPNDPAPANPARPEPVRPEPAPPEPVRASPVGKPRRRWPLVLAGCAAAFAGGGFVHLLTAAGTTFLTAAGHLVDGGPGAARGFASAEASLLEAMLGLSLAQGDVKRAIGQMPR